MRTPTEEYRDRDEEARFWAEYNARRATRGGRCALVATLLMLGTLLTVWAGC